MPGKFDLNSIATQNTQTACTLQLLVKPFGLGGGEEQEKGEGACGSMLRGAKVGATGTAWGKDKNFVY